MRDMDRTRKRRCNSFGPIRPDLCSRHNSPLDAYCCTDQQVICASCATSEHTGHTIGLVREERRRKQDEVRTLKKKCQGRLQEGQKAQVLEQIHEKASETEDFCEAVLTKVIDLLQTHYMSLRELIRAQHMSAVSAVEKQRTEEVKRRCSELDRLTHTDSDIHFLLEWPSVRQRCQEDLSDFTDALLLPFKTLQDEVEALGNRMQEFCNSGFALVTQNETVLDHQKLVKESDKVQQKDSDDNVDSDEMTEDHHVQPPEDDSFDVYEVACAGIEAADPKTREDFLLYAYELTMDRSTAHEDLLLSADLKEVTLAPQSVRSSAVRHPERFLYRRQLLCKEGLQDNCYYEIEVTGGQAEIALAYKGIYRRSRIKPSEFGGNANSWSLDCTSAQYSVSHRGGSVQLTSVPKHSRIGVFLKFRAGTVSFYEVSDTMRFLYMIEDDFTEPLYPGFWVGNNCRIRICDLTSQTQ